MCGFAELDCFGKILFLFHCEVVMYELKMSLELYYHILVLVLNAKLDCLIS